MERLANPLVRLGSWGRETACGLPGYARKDLRHDLVAGLTVTVLGVPQAMAYALIAGVPPVYGLYTAIATCTISAIFGSSSHLVTGPTNASCMVILSLTRPLAGTWDPLEAIFLVTIMSGFIQLLFGVIKLGAILRYVSNSVLVGFTAGAGILIVGNQLKNVMGVEFAHAESFYRVLWHTALAIPDTNLAALGIGLFTAVSVVVLQRIDGRIPTALIAVAASTATVYLMGWHVQDGIGFQVRTVGDIGEGVTRSLHLAHLPRYIASPDWELTRRLGGGAVALAILGLVEASAIARTVATTTGQRVDFNREFIGQGLGNLVGGFFSCFAGSGSFTRTALNLQAGARTRMAAIFSAAWTVLTILLLADVANYIPIASLAGLLIVAAYSIIEKHRLHLAWGSGMHSRMVLFGTLGAALILPLEYAIFTGVFLSIVFLLKITGVTDLTQLVPRGSGFDEVPFNRAAPSPIVTVNMEGDLYFAAVEDLEYELARALTPVTHVVVLRMKRLRAVGSTAMAVLEHFNEMLTKRNIQLVVCGIEEELIEVMTHSGLRERIGEPNIFYADNRLFQSTELAMARASGIVEMQRRREQAPTTRPARPTGLTARDLMTRQSVRFGSGHQLREAVWLLSEMNERKKTPDPYPLFLQDKEGKLAGILSMWKLLEAMTDGLDLDHAKEMDDEELGRHFTRHFTQPILPLARVDLPRLTASTSFAALFHNEVENDMRVLPVCDEAGRVMGLVAQTDLLTGLAKVLDSAQEETTSAADTAPSTATSNQTEEAN